MKGAVSPKESLQLEQEPGSCVAQRGWGGGPSVGAGQELGSQPPPGPLQCLYQAQCFSHAAHTPGPEPPTPVTLNVGHRPWPRLLLQLPLAQ